MTAGAGAESSISDHLALQLEFSEATQKLWENNWDLMDPAVARVLAKAIQYPEELDFEEGLIASSLVLNWLNEWEDRFLIHKAGLAGEIDWQRHIRKNIEWTLGSRFAIEIYRSNRSAFEVEFVKYVDTLLGQVSEQGTYLWWTSMQSNLRNHQPLSN